MSPTAVSRGGRSRTHLCLEGEGWAEGTLGVSEKGNKQLEESGKVYPSSIFHWILKQRRIQRSKTTRWGTRRLADSGTCVSDLRRAQSWEHDCGRA